MRRKSRAAILILALAGCGLAGCGSGKLQTQEEGVRVQWSEAVNLFQRRADLVPDVLATLRAAGIDDAALARAEAALIETRAARPTIALLDDPGAFARAQSAQLELRAALAALLEIADQVPAMSSDPGYRDLRAQLLETDRRIAQVRLRYADSVQAFNTAIRRFPDNLTAMLFDFSAKPGMARADSVNSQATSSAGDSAGPVARH